MVLPSLDAAVWPRPDTEGVEDSVNFSRLQFEKTACQLHYLLEGYTDVINLPQLVIPSF